MNIFFSSVWPYFITRNCISKKTEKEQDSKLIGLVKDLKIIFLCTFSVTQGQTIYLISAFTSEMLSLVLNSCWSEVEISSFLYQCSAFLAVVVVHDKLYFF